MPGGKRSGASGAAQGNTKRNRSGSSENDDQSKTPPINNQTEDSSTTSDAPDQGLPWPPANTPGAHEGPIGSYPGSIFHEVISQAAIIIGLPVAFYYLLKKYSIVSNRDAVNLKNAKAVEERIMKGWNMIDWIWGECVFVYDNIGFKCRGIKVGYHQFTHIQVIMVPYGFLKKFGVYCNNKVSRVRKVWKDIRSRCSPATLLPTEEDYNLFHERFLGTIGDILAVYDTFPDSEECEMMIEKWKESKKTLFDSGGVTVPAEFGERQLTNADRSISGNCDSEVEIVETVMPEGGATNAILTELEVDEDEVGESVIVEQGIPVEMDLNTDRCVQEIAHQTSTFRKRALEEHKKAVADGTADPTTIIS